MDDAIAKWLEQLAEGDEQAVQEIWERYYERLVNLARTKLAGHKRRVADEEDVALSAFNSFWRAAKAGRFPRLKDRDDLWKLLVTITARKAVAQIRRELSQKRGGGAIRGESVFIHRDAVGQLDGINQVLGREPTPELAALMSEQCEQLLEGLPDESLQAIALYKLEGYDNAEISQMLNCAKRTIERKLIRIRDQWEQLEA